MLFANTPRHTRQNAITESDLECILARNCESTEQLRELNKKMDNRLSRMNVRRQLFQFLRISNNMMCLYELLRTAVMSKIASPDQCGLRE